MFGVIRQLRERYPELELRRVDTKTDVLARLVGETERLEVYYDQSGPLRFFETCPSAEELAARDAPKMVQRHAAALEAHDKAVGAFLDAGSQQNFFSGRPDFLVLRYEVGGGGEALDEIIIGEVKYTRSASTFSSGLRELLEYVYFARENWQYLFENEEDDIDVTGLLCTAGVETKAEVAGSVRHLTTVDLSSTIGTT